MLLLNILQKQTVKNCPNENEGKNFELEFQLKKLNSILRNENNTEIRGKGRNEMKK